MTPEQRSRQQIDRLLEQSGWTVQDYAAMTLTAEAIAVREFPLKTGLADYLLLVDGLAIGAVETGHPQKSLRRAARAPKPGG